MVLSSLPFAPQARPVVAWLREVRVHIRSFAGWGRCTLPRRGKDTRIRQVQQNGGIMVTPYLFPALTRIHD